MEEYANILEMFSGLEYNDQALVADKILELITKDPDEESEKYIDRILFDVDNEIVKSIIREIATLQLIDASELIEDMLDSINIKNEALNELVKNGFKDILEILRVQIIDLIYHEVNVYPKKNRRKIINAVYKNLIKEYRKIKLEEAQELCEHEFGKWKEDCEIEPFWYHKCKKCNLIEKTSDMPEEVDKKKQTIYRGVSVTKRLENKKKKKNS